MRQFVRVTIALDEQMLIPVDRIQEIVPNATPGCRIYYSGSRVYSDSVDVMQSIDDMERKLNGQATTPDEEWGPDSASQLLERGPR